MITRKKVAKLKILPKCKLKIKMLNLWLPFQILALAYLTRKVVMGRNSRRKSCHQQFKVSSRAWRLWFRMLVTNLKQARSLTQKILRPLKGNKIAIPKKSCKN